MNPPRYWKTLERHPLSGEYPNLSPAARQQMIDNIEKHGILNKRKVTLHEGKVLDGWQMYMACVDLDMKPEFQPLPRGVTPEKFVEIVNDTRRHETQELAISRAVARRERIAAARANGESLQTIAESEGVSKAQVVRDLNEKARRENDPSKTQGISSKNGATEKGAKKPSVFGTSAVPGGTAERVKGRDGKSHPAKKKKSGQVKVDWKKIERGFSMIADLPERVAEGYPDEAFSDDYCRAADLLSELAGLMKAWKKRLSKIKE